MKRISNEMKRQGDGKENEHQRFVGRDASDPAVLLRFLHVVSLACLILILPSPPKVF